MISVSELKKWVDQLDDDAQVEIDESGESLLGRDANGDATGYCLDVGKEVIIEGGW